jgi:hypothetical protein
VQLAGSFDAERGEMIIELELDSARRTLEKRSAALQLQS